MNENTEHPSNDIVTKLIKLRECVIIKSGRNVIEKEKSRFI